MYSKLFFKWNVKSEGTATIKSKYQGVESSVAKLTASVLPLQRQLRIDK